MPLSQEQQQDAPLVDRQPFLAIHDIAHDTRTQFIIAPYSTSQTTAATQIILIPGHLHNPPLPNMSRKAPPKDWTDPRVTQAISLL